MHIPLNIALPGTLLSFLLTSSSTPSPKSDRSICVRQNAPILAEAAACGDRHLLQECFLSVLDTITLDDLRSCFIEVDCTIAEATSEAAIILESCNESVSAPELRRRGPEAMPEDTTESTPTPENDQKSADTNQSSISVSGIVVTVVLALAVVVVVTVLLIFYAKDRKLRAIAREKDAEEKRKQDQEASEAALRNFAKKQVARERERRQQMEAREWAHRRAGMENPRHENPFDDRSAAAA
ncbi:hypothetical protein GGR58DRAFT_432225 [Xylaria digitata]|nr:hypothetical protein GGR58DRAFT_432225 [Xylaria digitata]